MRISGCALLCVVAAILAAPAAAQWPQDEGVDDGEFDYLLAVAQGWLILSGIYLGPGLI